VCVMGMQRGPGDQFMACPRASCLINKQKRVGGVYYYKEIVMRQGKKAVAKRGKGGFFVQANCAKTLDCSKTRRRRPRDAHLRCRDVGPATRGCISLIRCAAPFR
jgi:hypothetical protein